MSTTMSRQYARKLAESAKELADWMVIRDFAKQMYGEGSAARVEVETWEEYDDQEYSYPIGAITAFDKDGNALAFDQSLPFFATQAWQLSRQSYADYVENADFEAFKCIFHAMSDKEKQSDWVHFAELPERNASYDLTKMPAVPKLPSEELPEALRSTTPAWTTAQIRQLAEEATHLADWTVVRRFARQVYGDQAVKVDISTYGEYNDEGGTDYRIESLTAYDKDGKELTYDLTLPFWTQSGLQSDIKEHMDDEAIDDIQAAARQTLRDWSPWRDEDKAAITQHGWLQWHDLPVDEHNGNNESYDLTQPPASPLLFSAIPSLTEEYQEGQ